LIAAVVFDLDGVLIATAVSPDSDALAAASLVLPSLAELTPDAVSALG